MSDALVTIWQIVRPWRTRVIIGASSFAGVYQFGCDQFDFPKLPALWGMTGAGMPWWGWLLIAQSGFVYALFEYVRRIQFPYPTTTSEYDDSKIVERVTELERIKKAIIDDYQRMSGLDACLTEKIESLAAATQATDQKAIETLALAEKIESVRVDGAIIRGDVERIEDIQKDHRERAQQGFFAIGARERLTLLESDIKRDASDLYDRLKAGEVYGEGEWQQWDNVHGHWEATLEAWLETARWYAIAVRERTLTVDDANYGAIWTVADSQFPNAEAVRRFKKFRIIQTQWEAVVPNVRSGLEMVAFSGLTDHEPRSGRPAG